MVRDYVYSSDELSLEAGIRAAHDAMLSCETRETKRAAFVLLADLHARRSPELVAAMERTQGLR